MSSAFRLLRLRWLPVLFVAVMTFPSFVAAQEAAEDGPSEMARLSAGSLLLDIARIGERYVAVGDRGHILLSDDRGGTWTQVATPTRAMLTAVTATGSQDLWAVGHDAVILHSGDAGQTWTRQYLDPGLEAPLLAVWFADSRRGLAVGAYGLALETLDGGRTWERRDIDEEEPHFYALFETADGRLLLAGEFGIILVSEDAGKSWTRLDSPYEGTFFGGLGLSDGSLLVFGLRGNLFRSIDGGAVWQRVETGVTASLLGGWQRRDGGVVLVGLSGSVLVGDESLERLSAVQGVRRVGFSAVVESGDGMLLLVGEDGASKMDLRARQQAYSPSAAGRN